MIQDDAALYSAFAARDARFDGVFFIGVTSTRIYCRPICTARTPKAANCRFFPNAAAAERASFRPCLRCRPELAPGNAPVDDARRIAGRMAARLEEGLVDENLGLEEIAAQFELSSRQLRRIVKKELGVSPKELLQTRRLLLAKQLLTETSLPVIEIAFASGFSSLRRFNDAFRGSYGMPPGRLRKDDRALAGRTTIPEPLSLQLTYRNPFDWEGLLDFLRFRTLKGVEWVSDDTYLRTIRLNEHRGWIRVRHAPEACALAVEITRSLSPALHTLLRKLRHLFDLDAHPEVIAGHLMKDGTLAECVDRNRGLRVPGAYDGFELAVRAILGQQVTVKAATTLAGRFADAFGEEIQTPHRELSRLSPTAERIAAAHLEDVASLGIVRTRARCIIRLAEEVASERLSIDAGAPFESTVERLMALPGIGPWTAQYIAMRGLRWPDAFPKEDIALRKSLGDVTAGQAEGLSQPWRPWRSYATLHLWNTTSQLRRVAVA